jgi:hypothetical protein
MKNRSHRYPYRHYQPNHLSKDEIEKNKHAILEFLSSVSGRICIR